MVDGKLSLVLPAYNEAANIEAVVERAMSVLPGVVDDFEVIIVDDGSVDGTAEIIGRLATADPRVRAVRHEVNRGYGSALTTGFDTATGDQIMFMDADQQFDIADINALLPYVGHYDIVAGYRIQRRDPFYRRLYGKLFGLAVWLLFRVRLRDTDCAFKIYRADLLKGLRLTTRGALINTEMLARSKRKGATIAQVGVHHYPRVAGASSGGSPRVVFRAMGETVGLWARLNREAHVVDDGASASSTPRVGVLAAPLAVVLGFVSALLVWKRRKRDE